MSATNAERDRPTVVRLLRETIVQLCRANAPFGGGRVEIDGIICITGSGSGQQLVVKVHEILHDAVDQAPGPPYPGLFDRDRYLSSVDRASATAADVGVETKRRRLDAMSSFDGLPPVLPLPPSALRPHQSALYDYLSRFGFSSSTRIGADLDSRFGVKDLSLKTGAVTSAAVSGRRDTVDSAADGRTSPGRRPSSPLDVAGDTADRRVLVPSQPRSVVPPYAERWSPSRPIPAIPQCFVCGYRFSSAEVLGEHNETVHSIFTCLCCFKTFTSRSNLERHSRLHTGHRPYSCPVCGKTFSRKDHLSNHATKHAYKCGTCTRRCSDESALAEHYRLEHPGLALAAVCTYCNKGFSSVDLYEEHVKVHPQFHVTAGGNVEPSGDQTATPAPPVRHQCQMCGFEAMDRVCLVQHQQLMHYTPMSLLRDAYDNSPTVLQRLDRPSYRCVICGFTTSTLLVLRQHEAAHVYDMPSPAHTSYNQCPRRSPTSEMRDRELIRMEGYSCQHCGQQFDTYASLSQHLQELSACAPGDETLLVGTQHRDKRKQKQPKPVMAADAEDNEDEEVNVVSPASADDKKMEEHAAERQRQLTDVKHSSDGVVSCLQAADSAREIRMEPIRSIMNRSSLQLMKVRERPLTGSPSPPPLEHVQDECIAKPETGSTTVTPLRLLNRKNSCEGGDVLSPSLRDATDSVTNVAAENPPSCHSSLDDLAVLNNNNDNDNDGKESSGVSVKCENQWLSSSMLDQTRCVVCGSECSDFADMEAHCLTEHSRSPCMYCPKTFAQKANRDRHMCLHTGDRPYGCPECGERFSRGDKLKMHRVRTHGVLYPLYGSRGSQRDRDGTTSSRNHSTSHSPMMFDSSDASGGGVSATVAAAVFNGSAASQDGDSPPVVDSDLHGSTSVLSGGEWIDLRISMCRESSKLQSALAGIASTDEPVETFPKRELTDDEVVSGQPVHGNM